MELQIYSKGLSTLSISDEAYNATTWNGVTTIAPSKNAVRDKIEALVSKLTGNVLFDFASSNRLKLTTDNGVFAESWFDFRGGNWTQIGYKNTYFDIRDGSIDAVFGANSLQFPSGVNGTIALTANKLSAFASTTSSELAGVISDETGTGALVFGTSPEITTSITTGSTTFSLINTTATTVNFAGGASTALNIGHASGTNTILGSTGVTTLTVLDTTYKVALDSNSSNSMRLGNGFSTINIPAGTIVFSGTFSPQGASTSFTIQTTGSTGTNGGTIITRNANITVTSGIANGLSVISPFAPTTGSAVYNAFLVNPILNQTGGTGEMNLIKVELSTAPNITTSLYGLRMRLAASPAGGGTTWNIYSDGTAANLFAGAMHFTAATKAQITANQNDYAIGTGMSFRMSSDASRNVTGITGGADGKIIIITNVGSFDIVFTNEDAASTAGNRVTSSTGANITVSSNHTLILQYDSTTSRWRDISLR